MLGTQSRALGPQMRFLRGESVVLIKLAALDFVRHVRGLPSSRSHSP